MFWPTVYARALTARAESAARASICTRHGRNLAEGGSKKAHVSASVVGRANAGFMHDWRNAGIIFDCGFRLPISVPAVFPAIFAFLARAGRAAAAHYRCMTLLRLANEILFTLACAFIVKSSEFSETMQIPLPGKVGPFQVPKCITFWGIDRKISRG